MLLKQMQVILLNYHLIVHLCLDTELSQAGLLLVEHAFQKQHKAPEGCLAWPGIHFTLLWEIWYRYRQTFTLQAPLVHASYQNVRAEAVATGR